jgi:peptidoglycan/xylan/chitin deacetylase (PgdA/CDA1 family)
MSLVSPLKTAVKNSTCRVLSTFALPRYVHQGWFPQEVSILMYHAVLHRPLPVADWCFMSSNDFRRQMLYLRRHLNVLSLGEAVARLENGDVNGPAAVITFDDGYQNNYDVAFPILSELRLPATIFLVTSLIDTDDTVWFCRINRAVTRTEHNRLTWNGVDYDLSSPFARAVASANLQDRLKRLTHDSLLVAVDDILWALGVDPTKPIEPGSPYRMLTGSAIETMARSGLIEFGAHSVTHSILTRVSPNRQRREIEQSVRRVAGITNQPCKYFAYPNGRAEDYDRNAVSTLRSLSIGAAVTTRSGSNTSGTPALELKRYGIGAGTPAPVFECTVHHLFDKVRSIASWPS